MMVVGNRTGHSLGMFGKVPMVATGETHAGLREVHLVPPSVNSLE